MRHHLILPLAWLGALAAIALAPLGAPTMSSGAGRLGMGTFAQDTATPEATFTPDVTAEPTLAPRATPTRTPTPRPVFMPVGIRDQRCDPLDEHVDVMFVLDGSSYMLKTHLGGTSWEIAKAIINHTLDVMDFTPDASGAKDQAGLVMFRSNPQIDPVETTPLSSNVAALRTFVDKLSLGEKPRDTARMDAGLMLAASWVKDPERHLAKNRPVVIFISEMQAKNVPYKNEPGCETARAGEECTMLKRAKEVKESGVTLVVFATDDANRGIELLPMASETALAIVRPSPEQIASTMSRLAPKRPCPRESFWPYKP